MNANPDEAPSRDECLAAFWAELWPALDELWRQGKVTAADLEDTTGEDEGDG